MTVRELRQKYLDFYRSKGHDEYPSGSLIPYDVTGRLDESLLFNGAGMVQFKPYFRGTAQPTNKRLTTAQKCLRTGDIEEVGDLSHLTFFEMLGNFSFGDYFKKDAIDFSWEFLTGEEWLGLDARRLSFTVFEEDDEAYAAWEKNLDSVGINASSRVFRLSEKTNYWPAGAFSSGPPGPCGPNSEMFYWTGSDFPKSEGYTAEDFLRDEEAGLWLEIWNDVFIQYEWQGELADKARPDKGYVKSGLPDLPFRSVDTGMGIERTVAVLSGKNSVYDTDAFAPIFGILTELAEGKFTYGTEETVDVAMRIVADHLRAACFCIADGVLPANNGRGYVLRRLIRRAILKGARNLGFDSLFMHLAAQAVIANFGDHYHELADQAPIITETLKNEESQFRRTLDSGSQMLNSILKDGELTGEEAFQLYDTFGFPLEVTQEIAKESGIELDVDAFQSALEAAQLRSRAASGMETVYGGAEDFFGTDLEPTTTVFYEQSSIETEVIAVKEIVEGDQDEPCYMVVLRASPFYAESGGQISDQGWIIGSDFKLNVINVKKQGQVWMHIVKPAESENVHSQNDIILKTVGQPITAMIDSEFRKSVTRNHTATHILHAVLRKQLGVHVTQAGSLVSNQSLRFDFTHNQALTSAQITEIEKLVYSEVLKANSVVIYPSKSIEEAREMGAMMLFGEKYGSEVRIVQIGDMPVSEPCFSRELCGGIHVGNTGEIGLFKILHESSAASGVRRIVAVTGEAAFDAILGLESLVENAAKQLKSTSADLPLAISKLQEQLKEERKKREKLAQKGSSEQPVQETNFPSFRLRVQQLRDADSNDVKLVADRLVENQKDAIALVFNVSDGKVSIVCKVGVQAQSAGAKAGDIVREAAKVTGGGGGGRPDFASAGGKDPGKVTDAVQAVQKLLEAYS